MYQRRVTRPKPLKSELKKWTAPIRGWVSNQALADGAMPGIEQGAAILDNFFPTSSVVRLRRGREQYTKLPTDALAIFAYKNGTNKKLFSATETNIYDITGAPVSLVSGLTSGDWTFTQFSTTGGVFIVGVNGDDVGKIYDGTTMSDLLATFPSGLTSADMSHVWIYKNRLWFAQKDSLNAYYLPVDSIAGAAVAFPLGGIFAQGGSLLFGQGWSLDSGGDGGLSEQCVFCSTQGEVAIYQGSDPATASDWNKVGVYRIGTPLGKNAFIRGGGDIAVATSVGLVPLSKAITLDITSLNVATISYNIADAWSTAVQQRGLTGWCCAIWPELKMAFVSPPDLVGMSFPVAFVSNTETGAWCRFTNWRMLCMEVFDGRLYFGSTDGYIYLANQTGFDDTLPYTGVCMPLFEDLGSPASLKIGKMARTVVRALGPSSGATTLHSDFDDTMPAVPDASASTSDNLWGTGIWGTAVWGGVNPEYLLQPWVSVGGSGYALSLAYQITSGSVGPLDAEIIRFDLTFTVAGLVT